MLGRWASESERLGFQSLGVIEPLTALAAAAARSERVELLTLVLFPCSGALEQVGLLAEALDLPPAR